VLADLQDRTNFSTTELEVLLNHFMEHQNEAGKLDRATFLQCLGIGEPRGAHAARPAAARALAAAASLGAGCRAPVQQCVC
jgi:hypothetical protein